MHTPAGTQVHIKTHMQMHAFKKLANSITLQKLHLKKGFGLI